MSHLSAFRYFAVISLPVAVLRTVLGVLVLGAGALEAVDRGSSDWVLASIALVQLFAASTGFTRHATRGHYDPVLAGRSRPRVALAHLAASASPGALAWVGCGICQTVAARSPAVPAFRPGGWAALLLVSAIPWAASVRTAPFVGGAVWLLASLSLLVSGRVLEPLGNLHARPLWAVDHPVAAFGLGLAFPIAIPSLEWPLPVLLGFGATTLLAVTAAVWSVSRADLPLAEEGG